MQLPGWHSSWRIAEAALDRSPDAATAYHGLRAANKEADRLHHVPRPAKGPARCTSASPLTKEEMELH